MFQLRFTIVSKVLSKLIFIATNQSINFLIRLGFVLLEHRDIKIEINISDHSKYMDYL